MAQLFAQQDRQPDVWVMSGAPTATVVYLSLQTTINYSSGSPDTLPANTPAVIYGTSDTAFDRSLDVWVPFTVRASGVLSIIKESLLATITADYVALARVELHSIKPYQPEPYLAAGGAGGGGVPTTTTLASAVGQGRLYVLGTEPSGWQDLGFDDSAWAVPVAGATLWTPEAGSAWITAPTATGSQAVGLTQLYRGRVALPAGAPTSATLTIRADNLLDQVWVNGTSLGTSWTNWDSGPPPADTVSVPLGALRPGQANVLAAKFHNGSSGGVTGLDYILVVGQNFAGATDPTSAEGDLIYRHNGALFALPIGTAGQELTVVSGDPTWATPAASGVSSVDVAAPSPLASSGGPLTTSGTITLSWATGQTANRVLASPNGSSGAVSLRALVGADIPVDASTIVSSAGVIKGNYQAGSGVSISGNTISATGSGGTVTSITLSMPGIFSVSPATITSSGTFSVTLANESANTVFAGPTSGSAAPTFRALAAADLPAAPGAGGNVHAHGHFL